MGGFFFSHVRTFSGEEDYDSLAPGVESLSGLQPEIPPPRETQRLLIHSFDLVHIRPAVHIAVCQGQRLDRALQLSLDILLKQRTVRPFVPSGLRSVMVRAG
ncbi:hypothetical protein Q8A67_025465 [Cirrhinus molitorella]|uniref:Uncharacterized protein n=1 Tax=Cirrhinus molitorella TaxID=172907 RepID=A0AA88P8E0_9TELE|nr:hypothetical protein Q8A67_025465 [Cirrhinus molitorella]